MSRLLRLRPLLTIQPPSARLSSSFTRGPAPPRLPADQQAEFERLQRQASVSSAFQHLVDDAPAAAAAADSASPSTDPVASAQVNTVVADSQAAPQAPTPTVAATEEDTMHPNYVRGAPPEFEGDVNPRTGEVGGPKREPLRWGAGGDWSYNGRVTDF
ncbi:succinate dehydrogenase cytochrome B subunit, mitochondrial [Colletotrichum spaethianum]|uniref:Succinate dehydrogenase assembly factor 4, mitochondrial n=1 Tax=Colletotrichum spaethianum TaxID=700344 RepID=A0AA37LHM2_9PEZI|nr:succinate dehydrogenase cytochrome B subunit, mitochondrial [Colletotrichum spaethianum]GKT44262.1 succinate dehydrogenase cytochrome B subunit, mitochondrial [Colletotrichum spaethianum]